MTPARITGPAILLPLELAPFVDAAIKMHADERWRLNRVEMPEAERDLAAVVSSAAAVVRQRAMIAGTASRGKPSPPAALAGSDSHAGAASQTDDVDTAQAAALLGVSSRRVRQLLSIGELTGRRDEAGQWRVDRDSVIGRRKGRKG